MTYHCTICGANLNLNLTVDQLKSMPTNQMTTVCEATCRNGHRMTIQALSTVSFTAIASERLTESK